MTNLNNQRFTRKQADRILADAAERESCDYGTEAGEGLTYTQIVQIAQEAGIDSKYLKRSAKDLVKEVGGLERAAVDSVLNKTKNFTVGILGGLLETPFVVPTALRKSNDKNMSVGYFVGSLSWYFPSVLTLGVLPSFAYYELFKHNPEVATALLTTQILTNIGSGFYEWYRREKNKLVEEMNGEDKK